jgi:hypothetical protein
MKFLSRFIALITLVFAVSISSAQTAPVMTITSMQDGTYLLNDLPSDLATIDTQLSTTSGEVRLLSQNFSGVPQPREIAIFDLAAKYKIILIISRL